jgi:hypothetical protein
MSDRLAAERACKDANPIIDGRKANVNLAYLGAKPRGNLQSGIIFFPHIFFFLDFFVFSVDLRGLDFYFFFGFFSSFFCFSNFFFLNFELRVDGTTLKEIIW